MHDSGVGAVNATASDGGAQNVVLARLDAVKRRVYVIGAAAGLVVTVLSWLTREPDDPFIAYVYPLLALLLTGFGVAVRRGWWSLPLLERLILGVVGAIIMGRLAWHFYLGGPIGERLAVVVGGHYWSVAALIVAGFVILSRRAALRFGVAVIAASALFAVTGAGAELRDPAGAQAAVHLGRVHGFLVLLLALTAAVAALREEVSGALARAEALKALATIDPLTNTANRRAGSEALTRAAGAAHRSERPLSVVAVDIDRFKAINDRYGHHRGDQVLTEVARVLSDTTRETDLVARWGGEEFLVIAPDTNRAAATRLAERCREALELARPGGVEITATFGVAELDADELVKDLLVRADQLLYDGKREGRNRVQSEPLVG